MPDGRHDVVGVPCRHHESWPMSLPQLEAGTVLVVLGRPWAVRHR
ncbi:hypothetical protein [Streptomyces sp. NPDC000878]